MSLADTSLDGHRAIVIVEPILGSPAARAGLLRGDKIVAIDGTPTRGRPGGQRRSATARVTGGPPAPCSE